MTDVTQVESIGARLHKARLKKKATIEQVYKAIKIHPKVIAALEEDRHDEFLSPTYIKAFLKSYCRYLDIDANKVISDYEAISKAPPRVILSNTKQEEKSVYLSKVLSNINWGEYIKFGRKWLLPIMGGVLAVFLIISVISLSSKAVKKIKGAGIFSKKAAVATGPKEVSPTKPLSIPQGQPLTLIVKTKGDVWLEIKSDGKTVFKSVLKKGSVEAYKADEKFQLWTGKGEFLDLVLNGNSLGSPGAGVIKKILLTREGLKIEKK